MEDRPRRVPRMLGAASFRVSAGKLLSTICLLTASIVMARVLGPTGRGVVALHVTLAAFTTLLLTLGVNYSARVLLVRPGPEGIQLGEYLSLAAVLAVLATAVGLLFVPPLLHLAGVQVTGAARGAYASYQASTISSYLLLDALNGVGRTEIAAMVDATGSALQLALVAAFAFIFQPTATGILLVLGAAAMAQALITLLALSAAGWDVRPRIRFTAWARLVRRGVAALGYTAGQTATFRVDRYLVGVWLDPAAVGVYAVAATASELLRVGPYALSQVLFHRLAARMATTDEMQQARRQALAIVSVLAVLVAIGAPTALRVAFGTRFLDAVTPFRILLLAELAMSSFVVDGGVVSATGRFTWTSFASLVGLGVVFVADVAWIPRYGLAGAAWASVVAYSVMAFLMRRYARRAGAFLSEAMSP